ncbi:hypothetical protein, partial [Enterobacter bugandensis]|uniref:hypothetical protein n=1 Tax=Enterobacter bugandensis TaxID=881260 RepID=UPI000ACF7EA3
PTGSSDSSIRMLRMNVGYGNNHNNTHSTVSGHSSKGSVNGYSAGRAIEITGIRILFCQTLF